MVGISVKVAGMIVRPEMPGMPRCQRVLKWGPVILRTESEVIRDGY